MADNCFHFVVLEKLKKKRSRVRSTHNLSPFSGLAHNFICPSLSVSCGIVFSLDVGSQASSSIVCPGQEKAGTTGFQEWAKNEEVELWELGSSCPGFYFACGVFN